MTAESLDDLEVTLKCVDANEVIYDEKEKYLHKISSTTLNCQEDLFKEILTNLQTSQDVYWNFLKQLVIIKEPRVRFKPHNDVSGLQQKIEEISLSLDVKTYLRDVAKTGYKLIKEVGLLNNLVEFDVERHATVDVFGKKLGKVVGCMDMVSLVDKEMFEKVKTDNKTVHAREHLGKETQDLDKKKLDQRQHLEKETKDTDKKIKTKHRKPSKLPELSREDTRYNILNNEEVTDEKKDDESSITRKYSPNEKKLSKLQRQKKVHELKDNAKSHGSKSEVHASKDKFTVSENNTEDNAAEQVISDRAIVTFVLNPRISVNAVQVFRQLLFLHMLPGSHIYLLVIHIGPLNEDQEMVLYKFIPCETLIDACKGTDTNILDLNKLEESFRTVTGQRLQKLADLKEYFKYYIYDCPGVKDHAKDNMDRLERYLRKKKEKKDRKKQEKENTEESESEFGSEVAEAWSQKSETDSWATVSEINESETMSAADLQNYMEELK